MDLGLVVIVVVALALFVALIVLVLQLQRENEALKTFIYDDSTDDCCGTCDCGEDEAQTKLPVE